MENQLLQTKLYIPLAGKKIISRPHLINQLNSGINHKLTLISAPAGFGKTTIVSEWIRMMERGTVHAAWYSIDETDNNPKIFLTYFIKALQSCYPEILKGTLDVLQSPQAPPMESILTTLINETAGIAEQICVVIDDYHLIESGEVDNMLAFMLDYFPPQIHLIILTREDPALPISRLRAKGELTELRAADLRFSDNEAVDFFHRIMDLDVTEENAKALKNRTEGWIAGLQLAGLALKGAIKTSGTEAIFDFIDSFSGTHRFILEYLIEEVLKRQADDIQLFLLQTAILDRFNSSLCDAVCSGNNKDDHQPHSGEILKKLYNSNLFIIPLDVKGIWYRYHHLFTDLLRQRLGQLYPDKIPELHLRASVWYEKNGLHDEAIEHAIKAGDYDRTADLVTYQIDPAWRTGSHAKLNRWLKKLPEEIILSNPHLSIPRALYLYTGGQSDEALKLIEVIKKRYINKQTTAAPAAPESNTLSETEIKTLRGEIAVIYTLINTYKGNVPGIIEHGEQSLAFLPGNDSTWRSIATFALGDAHGFSGNMAAAYKARIATVEICRHAGNNYFLLVANLKVAMTLREQASLKQTIHLCEEQIQCAETCGLAQTVPAGCFHAILGEALAEIGDLDKAVKHIEKGIDIAERGIEMVMLGWSYLCKLRVDFSLGKYNEFKTIIQKIDNPTAHSTIPIWIINAIKSWQIRVWLKQEKFEAAMFSLESRGFLKDGAIVRPESFDFFRLTDYMVYARVLIAVKECEQAVSLLEGLQTNAQEGGRVSRVIEILVLQSIARHARGETEKALMYLRKAIALAESERFMYTFLDETPDIGPLLYELLKREIFTDYIQQIIGHAPDSKSEVSNSTEEIPTSQFIEPLSKREIEVVQLISEGLSNREIADRLFVSLNTIKVHTRSIYSKLDVNSRTQAIVRARTLGILAGTKE